MEYFSWSVTAASIFGVVLNIHKHKACFVVWTMTNACWMVVDFLAGLYAQSALFAVYLCLALYGLWKWHHDQVA